MPDIHLDLEAPEEDVSLPGLILFEAALRRFDADAGTFTLSLHMERGLWVFFSDDTQSRSFDVTFIQGRASFSRRVGLKLGPGKPVRLFPVTGIVDGTTAADQVVLEIL